MSRPSSLTPEQRAEIIELGNTGMSLRQIAEQVGTSKDTVRRVLMDTAQSAPERPATPPPPPDNRPQPTARQHPAQRRPANGAVRPMTEAEHATWTYGGRNRTTWLGWW